MQKLLFFWKYSCSMWWLDITSRRPISTKRMITKFKFNHMQRTKDLMPPGNEHEITNVNQWDSRVLFLKKRILITLATRRWKIMSLQINDFFLIILRPFNLCEPAAGLLLISLCEGVWCDYYGILALSSLTLKIPFRGESVGQ